MFENMSMKELQTFASQFLTGGVSSNARINPYTGIPMYLSRAEGAYIWDHSGKKYIDYFMGHGACLLGHGRPEISRAVTEAMHRGWTAEFDSQANVDLAERLCRIIPSAEQIRFTSSGSESTALCMRIARAFTGKDKIIRIDGHFHGTNDYVLTNWLAGDTDRNNDGTQRSEFVYSSRGIPRAIEDTMIVIPWHNVDVLERVISEEKDDIAAIIMVPIDYNNGCLVPAKEYLHKVNDIAHRSGLLVIYDEILSCFRTGLSCAQGYFDVTPDLCAIGKVLSNGVPLSVVAGKKEVMSCILDNPPVASGGTYSGNALGVAAALATLEILSQPDFYPSLSSLTQYFCEGMKELFAKYGIQVQIPYLGSNFFIYFGPDKEVRSYSDFALIDTSYARKFFRSCIDRGIYFHTDLTVSAAHTRDDIDHTLEVFEEIVQDIGTP